MKFEAYLCCVIPWKYVILILTLKKDKKEQKGNFFVLLEIKNPDCSISIQQNIYNYIAFFHN